MYFIEIPLPHSRLPINYGKSNEELNQFVKGPIYKEEAECPNKEACGGKCMDSTSLEVMWAKNAETRSGFLHPGKQFNAFVISFLTHNLFSLQLAMAIAICITL
jgi:hypothetical protein